MEGVTPDAEVQDLEIEEAEDVTKDNSIGPATPMQPPAKAFGSSQTKAYENAVNLKLDNGLKHYLFQ